MTASIRVPWHQRLADRLQRPLSYKRAHQAPLYTAAHASALTAAYGWSAYALIGLFGWAGPAFALALMTAQGLLRRHLGGMVARHLLKPLEQVDMSLDEVASRVLPLSATTAQTYLEDHRLDRTYDIRFDNEGGGYFTTYRNLGGKAVLSICRGAVGQHYRRCVEEMGADIGTSAFIFQQAAVMAHERAHMTAPLLSRLCDFGSLNRAALLAPPTALLLAAGGVMTTPTASACFMALAAYGVGRFCNGLASRAEEYRADRVAVHESGTALPLAHIFKPVHFSLPQALTALFVKNEHPSFAQRHAAMLAADRQLTQHERTQGQSTMRALHDRIAARHPDMFHEKPAAATPAGALIRPRPTPFH